VSKKSFVCTFSALLGDKVVALTKAVCEVNFPIHTTKDAFTALEMFMLRLNNDLVSNLDHFEDTDLPEETSEILRKAKARLQASRDKICKKIVGVFG